MSSRFTSGKQVSLNGTADSRKNGTSGTAVNSGVSKPSTTQNSWASYKQVNDVIKQKNGRGSTKGVINHKSETLRASSPKKAAGLGVYKCGAPPLCIDESDDVHVVPQSRIPLQSATHDASNKSSASHQTELATSALPKNKCQVLKENCWSSICSDPSGTSVNKPPSNRDNLPAKSPQLSLSLQCVDASDHSTETPRSLISCSSTNNSGGVTGWNPICETPILTCVNGRHDGAGDVYEMRRAAVIRSVPCSPYHNKNKNAMGTAQRGSECTKNSLYTQMYMSDTCYSHEIHGAQAPPCDSPESTPTLRGAIVGSSNCSTPRASMCASYSGVNGHNPGDPIPINDDVNGILAPTLPTQLPTEEEFIHARATIQQASRPILVALLTSLLDDFPTLASLVSFRYETAMIALSQSQAVLGDGGGLQQHHTNGTSDGPFIISGESGSGRIRGLHESQNIDRSNDDYGQHQALMLTGDNGVIHCDTGPRMTNGNIHYMENIGGNCGQSEATVYCSDNERQSKNHSHHLHNNMGHHQNSHDTQQSQITVGKRFTLDNTTRHQDAGYHSSESGTNSSYTNVDTDGITHYNVNYNCIGVVDKNKSHIRNSVFTAVGDHKHRTSPRCNNHHQEEHKHHQLSDGSSVVSAAVAAAFGPSKIDPTRNSHTSAIYSNNDQRSTVYNHHSNHDDCDDGYSLYQPELANKAFHSSETSKVGKDLGHRRDGSIGDLQYGSSCGRRHLRDDAVRAVDSEGGLHGLDLEALLTDMY
eukprot:Tbor_TRINITY_DN5788_c6_g2::TRINITY_DN5788_c6_g2_i8::g.20653::m.20653